MPNIAEGLVYYAVFLFSTTLHEAAHAWAAMRGGDLTAYHGGQVSLDPIPHIRREPFGMVVLPILGVLMSGWPFGYASAPYDAAWARAHPRRAAWMALAGPAGNLLLVLLAVIAIRAGVLAGVFVAPESVRFDRIVVADGGGMWEGPAFLASVVFSLNFLLATFNLLPVPPLDGSGAVPLFLSREASAGYQDFVMRNRGLALVGILLAWRVFAAVFQPLWLFAVNLVYPGVHYG